MSSMKGSFRSRNAITGSNSGASSSQSQSHSHSPMTTASSTRRYSVLYYKRTNKVHKNRGTTREDGILTINAPPSCACTLVSADADDDDDEDDDDEPPSALDDDDDDDAVGKGKFKQTKKKKYQAMRKKMNKGSRKSKSGKVWGGVNSDLAKRAFGLGEKGGGDAIIVIGEDDTLALNGQWECEIVGVLADDDDAGSGSNAVATKGGMGRGTSTMMTMKKPPPKTKTVGGLGSRKVIQNRAPLGTLARKNTLKQPLLQSKRKVGLGGGVKRTLGSTAAKMPSKVAANAPPVAALGAGGKMRKDKNGEWYLDKPESDDDDDDDDDDDCSGRMTAKASNVPKSLLRNSSMNKRPRTVSGLGSARPSLKRNNNAESNANSNNNDFPGELGERINVPASIKQILRPHQREGIAFLWNCVTGVNPALNCAMKNSAASARTGGSDLFDDSEEESGSSRRMGAMKGGVPRGAVLADEMGLGKTLMTIATIFAYHRLHRTARYIVVCPSSLVSNWSKEFDKWLGRASQPRRVVVRNGAEADGLRNLKSFVPLKPNQSEVLILSYELFRMHVKVVGKARSLGILVVDEGHRLKNTSGSRILTALNSVEVDARILITGTPIQNNLSEFYNVANFAVPGILGDLSSFRRLYERPMSAANQKHASSVQKQNARAQSKALDAITKTFVLRRLQKDVLKSLLPPRMEILLFCKPTSQQCGLYRGIANRASKSIGSIGGIDQCNNPLMLLTEVRKLCTHPSLLSNGGVSIGNMEAEDASLSGKLLVLSNLLSSIRECNPTDKVVIISNFTSALTIIERSILAPNNMSSVRLDGSTANKDRGPIVDTFNSSSVDRSFAFLLSSKAGGCGLNLIGANRLIMVDADWNPATDAQAMARVYRQGQTKPCFIYRMFTTGTVEEVIYQRQLMKGNLAKLANDGGGKQKVGRSGNASFSKEELRDCFTLKEDIQCDTKRKLQNKWDDYEGASSLCARGCNDEPLLGICEQDDSLTFVRVVDDDDVDPAADAATNDSDDDEDNEEEASLDEDDMLSESSEKSFSSDEGDEEDESSEDEEFDG